MSTRALRSAPAAGVLAVTGSHHFKINIRAHSVFGFGVQGLCRVQGLGFMV